MTDQLKNKGVNRWDELLTVGGCGYDRTEGSLAIGDRGLVAVSLKPDVDGTNSGCFLDSILSWKYDPVIPG